MATLSKSGSSRRKGESPGKIKILMNGGSGKVVHSESENDIANDSIPEDLPEGTVVVEPQPVEDAPLKKKKEIPNRIDTSVLDNINCTACGRQLNPYKNSAIQKHPQLKVVICKKCEKFISSGEIMKDKDGIDEQCRWCGEGGRLVVCDDCASAFCKACVMRNFNRSEFNNINDQESWNCYLCDKSQLQGLRENYRKIRDTLKALQAKQKAKEQLNGDKDKVSAGGSSSRSNGRKAAEPGLSTDAQPLRKSGPQSTASDANGAFKDSDLALTVGDLAVDHMYVDVIMDKLSTATNTFKEMLRALRSQFHSTSPRAVDEAPPMFQFSFSASMDVNTKKQRCSKALNKGLITYLQSLKTILQKGHNEDKSKLTPAQKKLNSESVIDQERSDNVIDQERSENITTSSKKELSSSNRSSKRGQTDKAEKTIDDSHKEKSKQNKSGNPATSRISISGKGEKHITSDSKAKSSSESEKKVQSNDKDKSHHEKAQTAKKDRKVQKDQTAQESSNDVSEKDNAQCNFNIDDEENVAAKLDLIQELAEEMLKDNASEDEDNQVSEKEMPCESEEVEENFVSNCSAGEIEDNKEEDEKPKRKRKENNAEKSPVKRKKKSVDKTKDTAQVKEKEANSSDEDAQEEIPDQAKEKDASSNGEDAQEEIPDQAKEKEASSSGEDVQDEIPNQAEEKEASSSGEDAQGDTPDQAKKKETSSSDEEDKGTDSKSNVREEEDTSSPDPLSSDEENEISRNRKKKRKVASKSDEVTKPKAKNGNVKEKKEGKLHLSSKIFSSASKSKDKKDEQKTDVEEKSEEEKSKVEKNKEEKSKGEKSKEEKSKGEKSKEEKSKGEKSKEEKSKGEKSKEEKSKGEKSKEEKSKGEKSKEEKSKGEKSKEEKSSLDKEIDKFSKLPSIQKRKRQSDNEDESGDVKNDEKKAKTVKKSKPGPKSSKKQIDLDDLSSDPEDKVDSDVDEDSNEEDDLEPKVTFFLDKPEDEKEQGMTEENENELAKMGLLEDSDEEDKSDQEDDNSSDSSSELSDASEKSKKKSRAKNDKDSKKTDSEERDADDQSSDEENDSEENIGKKSKRIRSKLLDAKLSDSDSDVKKKSEGKGKKKDDDDSQEDSSGSSLDSDSSDNDDESDSDEEGSEEDEEKGKKSKKKGKKKGKRRKGKKKKGASDDEEEEGDEKKGKGKKRKRIKKMSNSSDDDEDKTDDDDPNSSKAGKRKKIRKVMSNKKLEDATKAAAKAEEKRRKRIAAKQREFNVETMTDDNNPMNCPMTTKLILEPGKEEEDDPLVQVNKKLIRKLKPHQVEAVQFMWDCMFESVKRSRKEAGAGCILAHCMGLGKTLSVISFVHTILSNEKALKMRTCLVVCPLNTVLNWRNECTMWLDKKDQFEVWELASCKQNAARVDTLREWQESGGIMILGYEMYRNLTTSARVKNKRQKKAFQECLVDPGPDLVVCDEGHILKNENSAVSKAMNQMKTRRRVVLTGTPLQNNLNESFVKPNLLGTRKEFNNRFISPIQNGQCTDSTLRDFKIMKARAHVLHEMLAGCVQRRDYSALTKFLPPKQEYVISVRLTEVQVELYEKYLSLSGQGVDGVFNNKGARLFKDYQNLMKIWTHPWVLKLAEIRDELKMKYDDEDSFIDDDSEEERSFSSSESDSDEEKKFNSDSGGEGMSLGPHSKRGTRRTRAKARRQAGEESDPEEVIAEWKSKSRSVDDDEAKPPVEPDKSVSNDWWAQFVTEDDKQKLELSNKLFLLFEILRMCEEIGDKVLIFSQSILSLNIIESFLETVDSKFQNEMENKAEDEETKEDETFGKSWTRNLDYYRMDGTTSAQNRQLWAQNFNDVENYRTRLFLISTKAGGLGINLVAANRVIIFDASWNPSHDVQSIFRVYRFGQIKPCYIYRFLAQGTMEEKIYERQVTKLSLSQRVVDEHQIERHFSANDLKELYNFRPERWEEEDMPTLALPKDPLLAEVLKSQRKCVVSFHEHDSLLENQVEQTLTEEEKKAAWEEYENEKKGIIIRGPGMDSMNKTASWPMMAAAQILSREQITATVQALRQQLPDLPEEMFHLHVQQALRRQVQMKQEEMRRMELMRMQEMTYLNMMQEAERGGMSHGVHSMQNMQNLAPWMQMQRLRAMQSHYMQQQGVQNLGGAYNVAGMNSSSVGNNPEEPIDLDEAK